MIIDDEKSIVESLIDALEVRDISARGYTDPQEAIESFRANPTDVVVVDYRLPGTMTGVNVIAELQKFRPYTQFILISGWISEDLTEETLSEHLRKILLAKQYFQKPVDPNKLATAIRNALVSVEEVSSEWKAIAQQYTEQSNVTHDQVREINEKIKEHLIPALGEESDI